jgi:uncharacterized protein YbbC (DUF1343 family)/CubicO group peptidase (beta-lactamase class C family)
MSPASTLRRVAGRRPVPYRLAGVCALFALAAGLAPAQSFPASSAIDAEAEQAVREGLYPGAVVIVGQGDKILHRKAYGQRSLEPEREPMTLDTIFDAASLTKVLATTPAIMKLFEQGKIRVDDPVNVYLPEFQGGKSPITVRDLMTHFSGLRPDLDLVPAWTGYETGIEKALREKSVTAPEERFVYSDINFELLGEIVHRVSGKPLDQFAREEIYAPLKMRDTMFRPPAPLIPRIAPTEFDAATGKILRGIVHDPTARFMGGVAGHAGVFTTADDLARFCRMLLNGGTLDGVRLLSPLTVRKFTEPATPPDQPILRGLGWDIDSPYSSNRGELYPIGSYGHTGFTGTSIWIDPTTNSYIIVLTNRVHPRGGRNINASRARMATAAAAALGLDAPGVALTGYNEVQNNARRAVAANRETLTGLDVLEQDHFAALKNRRVGLITNQTGLDRQGRRNVDAMRSAGVQVTALFSPEHGLSGTQDRPDIADTTDSATGLPVRSLYDRGRNRLTPEMLRGIDTLVFDIQDVGARFYTYSCTMLYALEEAARNKIPFWVLDRPNPITGVHVEGPLLDADLQSFTGCYALPVRHGMTLGELATMANAERKLNAGLHVVRMKGWQRGDWFDSTGLTWVDTSPNMRSLNAALLYPGIALIESSKNYSVGRGTDAPFEQIGADWIKGAELARYLNARFIPGVRVYPVRFAPAAAPFQGKQIEGARFVITNRDQFDSVRFGIELACALQTLYPGRIDFELSRQLIGSRKTIDALRSGASPSAILQGIEEDLSKFEARRRQFLLYP